MKTKTPLLFNICWHLHSTLQDIFYHFGHGDSQTSFYPHVEAILQFVLHLLFEKENAKFQLINING